MKKNKYFKAIVFIIIFVLGVFFIPFYKGVNIITIISQKRDYYALSEERQEVFDKMKIEYVNIKSRVTGTEPFNDGESSNRDGVDVSGNDDYIRTFDVMKYTVELGVGPNTGHEGVTTSSVFEGGVIKVRAKLPNQGSPTLMRWEQDAWMQNVEYSNDKTEIYAEYHVPSGVSITNANQNLTFTVKVDGYKKEVTSEMAPEFEVWMEGNKPDDATSSASSISEKDPRNTIISGHQSIDVVLASHNYKLPGKKNGVDGSYTTFGVGFAVYQDVSTFSDLRGIEYPVKQISTEINLEYLYRNIDNPGTDYSVIDSNTPGAINLVNGTEINTFSLNGDLAASGYYPANTTWWHQHSNYPTGISNCVNCGVRNSGKMTAILDNNKMNVSFKDFEINGVFPTKPWASNGKISSKVGYFAFGNIQLFVPHYTEGDNRNYDYTLRSTAKKVTYETINGDEITILSNESNSVKDSNQSNNTVSNSLVIRANGSIGSALGSTKNSGTNWDIGDNYFTDGSQVVVWNQYDVNDGPYEGGSDILTVWNANYLDITPYSSTDYYGLNAVSMVGLPIYDKSTIVTKFGVYKASDTITSIEKLNSAVYEDFDWYNSDSEARRHGKISGYYFYYPANKGYNYRHTLYLKFNTHVSADDVGKTTFVRSKEKVYRDAEKTSVIKYGGTNHYDSETIFVPTQYSENGELLQNETPNNIGETFLMIGNRTSIHLSVEDKDSSNNKKSAYDIQDGEIHFKISPTLWNGKAAIDSDTTVSRVLIKSILPNGLSYKNGSANKEPKSVTVNADGTTTIIWEYQNWQVNHDAPEYPEITFTADISASLENNASLNIKSTIYTEEDKRDEKQYRTSEYGVIISNLAGSKALKDIDKPIVEKDESFQVTSTLGNNSEEALRNVKTIEILPSNHDENGSIFSGNYTSKIVREIENQKFFYTTRNISEIGLTEDKYGKLTIKDVDLENDSRWSEVSLNEMIPSNATAIATLIPSLPSQSEDSFIMEVIPSGNREADTYAFTLNMTSDNLQAAIKTNTVLTKVVARKISGKAFVDEDRNGSYGEGDTLLKNHVVKLLNSSGGVIRTTQTNNNGEYEFLNIERGRYYVEFSIPNNYEVIPKGESSKANSNGRTDIITSLDVNPTTELLEVKNIDMGIRKIDAKIHVSYVEYGNTTNVFDSEDFDKYYGDSYNLDNDYTPNIPDNYEFKEKTNNYAGVVNSKNINIIYYYQKKDSKLTSSITKSGTEKLEKASDKVSYKITYKTKISDYLGNAVITIKDTLPYEIDEEESILDGGVYNSENHTITWTVHKNITSITETEITVEKNIKLKYLNINPRSREMINTTEGIVTLDNNERSVEDQFLTEIQIPGKIIVRYIEVDEKGQEVKEITDAITKTGLVGEEYTSEEREFEGYDLVKKPETEEYEFLEEEQIVTYQYLKKKVHVETITHGIGGKIIGDEDVYYGDDSTKNRIIIEAEEGYQIERITINGEEIEVKGIQTRMVLDNFEGMIEDKLIEVSFKKTEKIINPVTGNLYTIISILGVIMIFIGFIYYKIKAIKN